MSNSLNIGTGEAVNIGTSKRVSLDKWDPSVVAPPMWYDVSDPATITMGAGGVQQVDDKGSLGAHQIQNVVAAQPGLVPYGTGLQILECDGINHFTESANIPTFDQDGYSLVFFLIPLGSDHNADSVCSVLGDGNDWQIRANAVGQWLGTFINNTASDPSFSMVDQSAQPLVYSIDFTNAIPTEIYNNGEGKGNADTQTWDSTDLIFKLAVNRGGTRLFDGLIGELMYVPTYYRELAEGYLSWKWTGDGTSLYAGHKFKTWDPR